MIQAIKKHYNVEMTDDGKFYISLEGFIRYFGSIFISYYQNDYILSSFAVESSSEYINCFKLQIDKHGAYYAILSQPDRRQFADFEDGSGNPRIQKFTQ